MAASLEQILSHGRRIPRHQISSFFLHHRHFFSSSDHPQSNPPPPPPPPPPTTPNLQPRQIQPVSYALKPKPELEQDEFDSFTREDIRYVKDSPLSYPKRVAPLPEDRAVEKSEGSDELESESRRIDADSRAFRRVFRVLEEEKEVPFPSLIKVEKKQAEKTVFDLQDAIRQVKANAKRNFDETVEAHVNLGIDRRRSDLGVSGSIVLPHGTGKIVKVAVFAEGAAADEAKAAGADIIGGDELIEEIRTSGKINFDKCIATHSMMQRVTKIGKILRGLTPNAKRGTVTNKVAGAVKEAKQGLLDFRMKDSIVHVGLGKVSFQEESLHENIGAFVNALLLAKPAGLKKNHISEASNNHAISSCSNTFSPCMLLQPADHAMPIVPLHRSSKLGYYSIHSLLCEFAFVKQMLLSVFIPAAQNTGIRSWKTKLLQFPRVNKPLSQHQPQDESMLRYIRPIPNNKSPTDSALIAAQVSISQLCPISLAAASKYAGYVNSFHLCSTMGPGFPVSIQSLSRAADLYNKLHPR